MSEENEITETTSDAEADTNLEARAKRMGWIGKEKFNGPDSMFVDAAEFIEKGENELPILRDRLRKQDDQIVANGRDMAALRNDMATVTSAMSRAEKRSYDEGFTAAKARQRTAVEEGDTYAFDQAQAEIDALPVPIVPQFAEQQAAPIPHEVSDFTSRHKEWYMSDLDMTSFADKEFDDIMQKYPKFSLQQQLEAVETRVKRQYPDKFGAEEQSRNAPSEVNGSGRSPDKSNSGQKFSDLPEEAQEICDILIRDKVIKNRTQYVKDYYDG